MGLGACCTHGIEVQPPDAVVGQHKPTVLDCGQYRIGYGKHYTRKSLPVPCAWNYRAEDNPVRCAMGPVASLPVAHHQPATEQSSGLKPEAVVQQRVKLGSILQPEPPALPGNLSVASSTAHLLRLPVQVHRACGSEGQCTESCSCLTSASWKPAPVSAWNGMCTESCGDAAAAAVVLVDIWASQSFVSTELVSKFSLPVKPGGDMEVTLADGSQVEVLQTCCVPLVVCSGDC